MRADRIALVQEGGFSLFLVGLFIFTLGVFTLSPLFIDLAVALGLNIDGTIFEPSVLGPAIAVLVSAAGAAGGSSAAAGSGGKGLVSAMVFLVGVALIWSRATTIWMALESGHSVEHTKAEAELRRKEEKWLNSKDMQDARLSVQEARLSGSNVKKKEENAQLRHLREEVAERVKREQQRIDAIPKFNKAVDGWTIFWAVGGIALLEFALAELVVFMAYIWGRKALSPPAPAAAVHLAVPSWSAPSPSAPRSPPPTDRVPVPVHHSSAPPKPALSASTGGGGGGTRAQAHTSEDVVTGRHPGVEGVDLTDLDPEAADGLDLDQGTWRGIPLLVPPRPRKLRRSWNKSPTRLWPHIAAGSGRTCFIGSKTALRVASQPATPSRRGPQPSGSGGPADLRVVDGGKDQT